ncbi:MAG: hypothetical protein OEV30_03530 [Ignavibacteria bacterium]|nr:hypothetical protein [Ignavibacteria bacterium]
MNRLCAAMAATLMLSSFSSPSMGEPPEMDMNQIAESYVRLVLSVGEHDADYVDAYYGPTEWREDVRVIPIPDLIAEAEMLLAQLERIGRVTRFDEMGYLRFTYQTKQLQAVRARLQMLEGVRFTFDEEARALYDATPPSFGKEHFRNILARLDKALPAGEPGATIQQRVESYRAGFVIPKEKLDTVFRAAIAECRKRTGKHLVLPEGESFVVEYVTDKPWSAYNWYKGKSHSLIQVNTDLPIFIDRAIDLAAHEGYPGHHVYNALLEKNLAVDRGWMEFSVYPLFSPQSLVAEGSANFGVEVAFPGNERVEFEQAVLFPLAGIDPSSAGEYYRIFGLTGELSYAGNEAARRYLDGEISGEEAAAWLVEFALMSPERAAQRVRFIDRYRSYVINYNLGEDLVRNFIEARGGTPDNPAARWEEFGKLLSSPRLPSGLTEGIPSGR